MPTVRTNGVETYYERRGTGPPIVFVHAAVLDHSQWEPQVDRLADEYTTVTYDVRGHGRTGGSTRDGYSVERFADDLRALVTALDLEDPVVCGHSTGGCVAQVYADRYGESLGGLVLASTFSPTLFGWTEWLQRVFLLRATIPPVRFVGYERVERAKVWLHERFHGGAVSGDYENVERLREEGPKMTTDEFAKVVRAVTSFDDATVDLPSIAVPTLVLYGEHEPGFVRKHVARFEAEIPEAVVREVPGAGHASNLDNPAFVTGELRTFRSRVFPRDVV